MKHPNEMTRAELLAEIARLQNELSEVNDLLAEALAKQESAEKPVAFINVEERTLEWNGPIQWLTPTTIKLMKIPLYTTPTAAIENFRNRAVAVCRDKAKSVTQINFAGGCEWSAEAIAALPLF